jgi:hypothetical protein
VGPENWVASGWDECTRHESDEGTNPYEKERVSHPSSSGICKDAPMGMDEHKGAAKAKRRGCWRHGDRRNIYQLATCLHLRKTRKYGEMARTAQQTSVARAHGGARRAACRCSSAASQAR